MDIIFFFGGLIFIGLIFSLIWTSFESIPAPEKRSSSNTYYGHPLKIVKKEMEAEKKSFRIVPSTYSKEFLVQRYLDSTNVRYDFDGRVYTKTEGYSWVDLDKNGHRYDPRVVGINDYGRARFVSQRDAEDFIKTICKREETARLAQLEQERFVKDNPPKIIGPCS